MTGYQSVTSDVRDYRWDEHPKGGWDEFAEARRRHFENLAYQSQMVRRAERPDTERVEDRT